MPTSIPEPKSRQPRNREPEGDRTGLFRLVLARSGALIRRRFWFYLALAIVANLPVFAAYVVLGDPFGSEATKLEDVPVMLAGAVVFVLLGPVVASLFVEHMPVGALLLGVIGTLSAYIALGATAHAVAQDSRGRVATLSGALSAPLRRAFVVIAVGLACDVIRILATPLLVVPGVIVLCALSVAVQACVVEGLGLRASLLRSLALTRGRPWTVLAVTLLAFPSAAAAEFVTILTPGLDATSLLALRMILGTVAATLVTIVFCVLYECLREQEGPADRVARVFS